VDNREDEIRLTAVGWSVEAMISAADRVSMIPANQPAKAFAAFAEALWWITVVNDSLVNRFPDAYVAAAKLWPPGVKDTVAGLRSVRHRIAHEVDLVEFFQPVASEFPYLGIERGITAWTWKSVPPPTRTFQRDVEGHQAYERAVAGQNVVGVFSYALSFFRQVLSLAQSPPP
jgi:hypothetical protein